MSHASTGLIGAHATADRIGGNGALRLGARALAWIAEQRRVSRTIAKLSDLSDRTLADIGIERSEIARVARYGRET